MKDIEKRDTLMYLFGKVWHYSKGNRLFIALYWVMFALAEVIDTVIMPIIWAAMIETVTVRGITDDSLSWLYKLAAMTIGGVAASWLFHGPARLIEQNNAFGARTNYRRFLMNGVMAMPLEWHVDHHSGDTIDRIGRGTNSLFEFSESSFTIIRSYIQLIGCFIALGYFSHISALIVFVMLLINMWIVMRFDKVLLGQYKELNRAENQISESIFDAVSNISTVIILRVEEVVFKSIMQKVEKPFALFKLNNRLNEIKWFLSSMCCESMVAIIAAVYFYQHRGAAPGTIVASLYLLIAYLRRMSDVFYRFTEMYGNLVRRKARIINSEELARDFRERKFAKHFLSTDWKEIQVSGLSFSYADAGDRIHLDDVSFSMKRGERIAFVGATGSGKTTFLKVMRDLYHPQSLTLTVDGNPIPNGFGGIAADITLVPQKSDIFASTILHNVTMGVDYSMDHVQKFTDMACFTEDALALPKGFDSSIKEKGVNLSGGQGQRLALSRGLLAGDDKGIILLDEPTSSLDTVTEIKVYENIFAGFAGKTIVSTIHQLHLLPLFDRICVFDKGEIVASGTLSELLVRCPRFISLWEAMKKGTKHAESIEVVEEVV